MSDDNSRVVCPVWAAGGGVALYLLVPGHPGAGLTGRPLDLASLCVLAAAMLALWMVGPAALPRRVALTFGLTALTIVAVKGILGVAVPAEGWRATYFANATWSPPAQRSTDFPDFDATRLDRAVMFRDATFPVHFFNETTFNRGIRREVSEPLSVAWTGYVHETPGIAPVLSLTARGHAAVYLDGQRVLAVDGAPQEASASTPITLAGHHDVRVEYAKPADTDGLIEVTVDRGHGARPWGAPEVRPHATSAAAIVRAAWLRPLAIAVHAAAFGLLVTVLTTMRRAAPAVRGSVRPGDRLLYAALAALFLVQGVWKAWPLNNRFVSLSSGDDWLQYEGIAREVLLGGPLLTFGQPLGAGDAFFYYPFYSYFLAAVHWLAGEHLAGVIVVQFVALLLATVVMHRLARHLFGDAVALVTVGMLVAVEQLAFVRYYTTTLLAENLFFLTVPAAIYGLTRFVQTGRLAPLVFGGLLCGVSAITKPSIMLLLPPAVLLVGVAARRGGASWPLVGGRMATFAAAWAAVVSLTLVRNYVVSGEAVLITAGQQWSFVLHNLPSNDLHAEYLERLANADGSYLAAASLLFRLLWNYPVEFLSGIFVKVMFSLGMIHWMGGRVHPELLALSAAYILSLVTLREARSLATWPAHLFVATHLVTMTVSNPSIYGYRLILPMYLFFAPFAGLLVWRVWLRLAPPRALRWSRATT